MCNVQMNSCPMLGRVLVVAESEDWHRPGADLGVSPYRQRKRWRRRIAISTSASPKISPNSRILQPSDRPQRGEAPL